MRLGVVGSFRLRKYIVPQVVNLPKAPSFATPCACWSARSPRPPGSSWARIPVQSEIYSVQISLRVFQDFSIVECKHLGYAHGFTFGTSLDFRFHEGELFPDNHRGFPQSVPTSQVSPHPVPQRHAHCSWDWLVIKDGDGSTLLGKTCGSTVPGPVRSKGNHVKPGPWQACRPGRQTDVSKTVVMCALTGFVVSLKLVTKGGRGYASGCRTMQVNP